MTGVTNQVKQGMGNASEHSCETVRKLWALPTPKYVQGGACYQAQLPDVPWLVWWLAIFVLFSLQECPMRELVGAFVAAVAAQADASQHCW